MDDEPVPCRFCASRNIDSETLTCRDCGTTSPLHSPKAEARCVERLLKSPSGFGAYKLTSNQYHGGKRYGGH